MSDTSDTYNHILQLTDHFMLELYSSGVIHEFIGRAHKPVKGQADIIR